MQKRQFLFVRFVPLALVLILSLFVSPGNVAAITNTHSAALASSSSQYFTAADSSSLDVTGDITMEAWVKPASTPTAIGNEEVDYTFVAKWDNDNDQRSYFFRYVKEQNNGPVQLGALTSSSGTGFTVGGVTHTLPVGEWSHVAMVCSGSTLTIYVDGSSIGTSSCASSKYSGNSTVGVGALINSDDIYHFDGLIDEVRIWSDARTQSEIENNMYVTLTGSESNLVAYWTMNGTTTDKTANGNTLTSHNSAGYSAEPAHKSTCSFDYSSMFSGTLTSFPSCSIALF